MYSIAYFKDELNWFSQKQITLVFISNDAPKIRFVHFSISSKNRLTKKETEDLEGL